MSSLTKVSSDGNANKKNNLMSIIDSLHSSSNVNQSNENDISSTSMRAEESQNHESENSDVPCKTEPKDESKVDSGAFPAQESSITEKDSQALNTDNDLVGNILKMLYQAMSNNTDQESGSSQPSMDDTPNDEALLEMQHPPTRSKSAVQPLLNSLANGTQEVKSIIHNDINLVYECRRCKGLFRALPNLLRHKKEYCRDIGVFSSFMNRPTNSTEEEDTAFQRVLSALHPPESSHNLTTSESLNNSNTTLVHNIDSSSVPHGTYLIPVAQHPIQSMPSNVVGSSFFPRNIAPSVQGTNMIKPGQVMSFMHNSASNFTIGKSVQNGPRSTQSKKHFCPLCKKVMSERKSVRRHLVRIHKLSVMDALKLVHSGNGNAMSKQAKSSSTTSTDQPKSSPHIVNITSNSTSPKSANDSLPQKEDKPNQSIQNLNEICIEILKLGDGRKINVLPSTFKLFSKQCPVCPRVLCRRTNVRRHLLESHNFIIKGDKKYDQLKELLNKKGFASPSLRTLRTVKISGTDDKTRSAKKNTVGTKVIIGNGLGTQMPSLSLLRVNQGPETENITESNGNSSTLEVKQEILNAGKYSPDSVSQLQPSSLDEDTFTTIKIETNDQEMLRVDKQTSQIDRISSFECPYCNKSFSRMRTLRNHMFSFHNISNEEFNQKYITSNSSNTIKRASEQAVEMNDEPPQKSRKLESDLSGTNILNHVPITYRENVSASQQSSAQGDLEKASPTGMNTSPTVSFSNGTDLLQGDEGCSNRRIVLRKLGTASNTTDPSTSTMVRPLIEVKLKRTIIGSKEPGKSINISSLKSFVTSTNTSHASSPNTGIRSPKTSLLAKSPDGTNKPSFDIGKQICYTCHRNFATSQGIRSHLLQVHRLSNHDALAASRDCSPVSEHLQRAGLEHGYDIMLAKCILCNKLCFSREYLANHMKKIHHLSEDEIKYVTASYTSEIKPKKSPAARVQSPLSTNSGQPKQSLKVKPIKQQKTTNCLQFQPPVRQHVKLKGSMYVTSKESVIQALQLYPKNLINSKSMRCIKCKHRYKKMWDLKVHLLKHTGTGLYACKHCPKPTQYLGPTRSEDVIKHLTEKHQIKITAKNRLRYLEECRVNNDPLWAAYDFPLGRKRVPLH
uniref:uncharacterized protein LOC120342195 isoform X1 n=1 Tax=Styela clava TaxID=7725 RepID=UPI0019397795|nr:uncharacterized protein LOC120342195 isoform X1 [Styela clava]